MTPIREMQSQGSQLPFMVLYKNFAAYTFLLFSGYRPLEIDKQPCSLSFPETI